MFNDDVEFNTMSISKVTSRAGLPKILSDQGLKTNLGRGPNIFLLLFFYRHVKLAYIEMLIEIWI